MTVTSAATTTTALTVRRWVLRSQEREILVRTAAILSKMKEAFLGKKSVSNQRSLAQSEQELALVTVQFIQAAKKMVEGRSFNCTEFKYN
jgi:hypothetical protein